MRNPQQQLHHAYHASLNATNYLSDLCIKTHQNGHRPRTQHLPRPPPRTPRPDLHPLLPTSKPPSLTKRIPKNPSLDSRPRNSIAPRQQTSPQRSRAHLLRQQTIHLFHRLAPRMVRNPPLLDAEEIHRHVDTHSGALSADDQVVHAYVGFYPPTLPGVEINTTVRAC